MRFRCVGCGQVVESEDLAPACQKCGSALLIERGPGLSLSRGDLERLPPGVWRYRDLLPKVPVEDVVTLGEGGTPLLHAERLGAELGLSNLLIKDESRNPTGSFLDRGTTVLVSVARADGVKECGCVTTGNLGASLAAYCAKAGIDARIRINPNTDQGKLYQMLAYGAQIETGARWVPGGRTLAVTAGNPYLLEGEETTGFEIIQDLGWDTPDLILVPVGTGGHLSMIWRGIAELREAGLVAESGCMLVGVQLEEPTARGRVQPSYGFRLAELAESEPLLRGEASRAMAASGGFSLSTTPGETISATGLLAKTEGIFAEPSAASVVAALAEATRGGRIRRSDRVVCVITGAGLKDAKSVSRLAREARKMNVGEPYALPSARIGDTKFALLRLLHERPSYGYELRQRLGPERRMSTASVYQHLTELDGLGMVRRKGMVVSKGRERVIYELTRRGGDYLRIAGRLEHADRPRSYG